MRTYRSAFVPSSAFAVLLCTPENPPRPGLCLCVALRLLLAKSLFESILPRSESLKERSFGQHRIDLALWSMAKGALIEKDESQIKSHKGCDYACLCCPNRQAQLST